MNERGRKIPMRMCVGCRKEAPRKTLFRIVRAPSDEIFLDRAGRAAGRGAYVCSRTCFEDASKNHRIDRALHCSLSPETLQTIANDLEAEEIKRTGELHGINASS